MPTDRQSPFSRSAAAAAAALTVSALAWTTWLDIHSGTQRVEQVMRAQATSIAQLAPRPRRSPLRACDSPRRRRSS